jgi:hypothetical protein
VKLPLLSYLAIGSQCVTIVFGILHYRTLDAGLKTLLYFFVADFSLTLVSILMAMAKTNNLWIIQLDSLLRFSVFIAAYALWQERKIVRSLLIAMIVAYAAFWGWYSFFNHTFGEYDTVTRTITKATLASVSVFFLYALSNRDERKMSDDFRFWVALGTLTYCSGTLFLSSFGGSVLKSFEMYSLVWPINWVLFAIANGFYSKAMVCSSRR